MALIRLISLILALYSFLTRMREFKIKIKKSMYYYHKPQFIDFISQKFITCYYKLFNKINSS